MIRFLLACALGLASFAARADTVLSIVSSNATEWVGQGQSLAYTNANATFTVTGTRSRMQLRVVGADGKTWDVRLKAPVGQVLRPRRFQLAEREGFETGRAPSLDFSGDGRACGDVFGEFSIRQIGFDATGRVNLLDASLIQRCVPEAPPLAAVIMYRAPKLSFKFDSTSDFVAGALSTQLYGDTALFNVATATPRYFHYGARGNGTEWMFHFTAPPYEDVFHTGMYLTTFDNVVGEATMSMSYGSLANHNLGRLEILSIAYDSNREIVQLSARYWFYGDAARTKPVSVGTINFVK